MLPIGSMSLENPDGYSGDSGLFQRLHCLSITGKHGHLLNTALPSSQRPPLLWNAWPHHWTLIFSSL